MNLEIKYPELKEMKPDELFVEWAYISKNDEVVRKVFIGRVIKEVERPALTRALKFIYDVKLDKDNNRFEYVDFITIEK